MDAEKVYGKKGKRQHGSGLSASQKQFPCIISKSYKWRHLTRTAGSLLGQDSSKIRPRSNTGRGFVTIRWRTLRMKNRQRRELASSARLQPYTCLTTCSQRHRRDEKQLDVPRCHRCGLKHPTPHTHCCRRFVPASHCRPPPCPPCSFSRTAFGKKARPSCQ